VNQGKHASRRTTKMRAMASAYDNAFAELYRAPFDNFVV
jgi:hypothetical protein